MITVEFTSYIFSFYEYHGSKVGTFISQGPGRKQKALSQRWVERFCWREHVQRCGSIKDQWGMVRHLRAATVESHYHSRAWRGQSTAAVLNLMRAEWWEMDHLIVRTVGRGRYSQSKHILSFFLSCSLFISLALRPPSFLWYLPSPSHWVNPTGSERVREFRWCSPHKSACWSADFPEEEWRIALEGQMEDNQYKTPSCFLWILLFVNLATTLYFYQIM